MTHTYAVLDVSAACYAEIRRRLAAADYRHAFHGDVIDMHGIAIRVEQEEQDGGNDDTGTAGRDRGTRLDA